MPGMSHHAGTAVSSPHAGAAHAWLAFLAFHVASALVMVAVMASVPEPSGKVALIYAPTVTATEAFLRAVAAGARPIRPGNFAWIIVVAPEPDDTGFATRAHAGGALAIVNPMVVGGCSNDRSPLRTFSPMRSS
jgi:hypothetical protein